MTEAAKHTPGPVAEVVWYDPKSDMLLYERPQKIIDGTVAFMTDAPLGTKLYEAPPVAAFEEQERLIETLTAALETAKASMSGMCCDEHGIGLHAVRTALAQVRKE